MPEPATDDEIGRLARTMNAMLARLEDATDRQRRFVADASHELRSPLTGIRAQLEVDLEHPELADWQATEREVLADAIRLQRLVDDLLVLARGRRVRARRRAAPRAGRPRRDRARREPAACHEPHARSPSTRTAVSGAQVDGNADQLLRVVRNLLDNAARHARSAVVDCRSSESSTDVTLHGRRRRARHPRRRPASASSSASPGSTTPAAATVGGAGLGLAIVHDVVVAHGGSVAVENTPGASFTVVLPVHAGV